MVLCFSSNSDYLFPLTVAICSVAVNAPLSNEIVVYIFHQDISQEKQRQTENAISDKRIALHWIFLQDSELGKRIWSITQDPVYFKIFLGGLLPSELTKIICLDSDIVVTGNIDELWNQELIHPIAAVRDFAVPKAKFYPKESDRYLFKSPETTQFNTGLFIASLTYWRNPNLIEEMLNLIEQKKIPERDQGIANYLFQGKWRELNLSWNYQTPIYVLPKNVLNELGKAEILSATISPKMVHYTGVLKPWKHNNYHPEEDLFYHYVDLGSFKGWRGYSLRGLHLPAGSFRWLRRERLRFYLRFRSFFECPSLNRDTLKLFTKSLAHSFFNILLECRKNPQSKNPLPI